MTEPQIRERVLAEVDALADDLVQMTIDTVRIPSVNPTYPGIDQEAARGGETRVNEFCQPLMQAVGLETDLWESEEGRANLAGTLRGVGGGRSLLVNGRVDVGPPGPDANWSKAGPWSGEVIDGKIWGRGSCDMKGGNAAALTALRAVLQAGLHPKGDVILEFVVGEEMMNTEAGTGAAIVLDEARRNSATLGHRVRVSLDATTAASANDARSLEGLASDLDAEGRLLITDDVGTVHTVAVGDVVHLRPA